MAILPLDRTLGKEAWDGAIYITHAFSVGVRMVWPTVGSRKLVYNYKYFARRWRLRLCACNYFSQDRALMSS